MRIEEGRLPDLETFTKICHWLGRDPSELLGFTDRPRDSGPVTITGHFRADRFANSDTVAALAEMLVKAAQEQGEGSERPPDEDT